MLKICLMTRLIIKAGIYNTINGFVVCGQMADVIDRKSRIIYYCLIKSNRNINKISNLEINYQRVDSPDMDR